MKTRIITALLIILCVVPPLVYGGWLIDLLIAFIIVAGGIELLNLKEQDAKWPLGIKTLAIVAVFVLVLSDERLHVALLGVLSFYPYRYSQIAFMPRMASCVLSM